MVFLRDKIGTQFSNYPEEQEVSASPSGALCICHWDTFWQICTCSPFSVPQSYGISWIRS